VPDENNHVLVRINKDRRLLEPSESLYSKLEKQPCVGTYCMTVTAEPRIGRTAREALMTVRFTKVMIKRPKNLRARDYPPSLSLYAVEVKEVNPPEGQKAVSVAVRTLQMVEGRENVDLSASVTFNQEQQDCLNEIEPTLQGKTKKQQNPYPRASLPWAIWIIARLGGASGYSSQGLPGMPTLVKGLRRFESIFEGWNLGRNRLVYTR
jgi:hypothetical protein